jgi:hypothetical protein
VLSAKVCSSSYCYVDMPIETFETNRPHFTPFAATAFSRGSASSMPSYREQSCPLVSRRSKIFDF